MSAFSQNAITSVRGTATLGVRPGLWMMVALSPCPSDRLPSTPLFLRLKNLRAGSFNEFTHKWTQDRYQAKLASLGVDVEYNIHNPKQTVHDAHASYCRCSHSLLRRLHRSSTQGKRSVVFRHALPSSIPESAPSRNGTLSA